MSTHRSELALPLVALVIFACRAALGLALISPWQQPDEPSHAANIELRRSQLTGLGPDPAREGEILHSMARYDWWAHRGRRTPERIQDRFAVSGIMMDVNTANTRPALYYRITGRLLSLLPRMSVTDDLYLLRSLSAAFSMLTIVVAWLGAREWLGAAGSATVAFLVALHPQFVVMSTAVSADAMVNLLGACVWWQAVTAVRKENPARPLSVMWLAALLAGLADRSAFPLLLIAFAVSVVAMAQWMTFRGRKAILAVLAVAAVGGISIWFVRTLQTTFTVLSDDWFLLPVAEAIDVGFIWRFSSFLFQSWWFSLGWVRYPPPAWWTFVAFVLVAAAAVGMGRRMYSEGDARTRMLLGLTLMSLAVQLFAVHWAYFRLGHGAQGKSLFPVLVPTLVLLWTGLEAWVPASRRTHVAVAVVLFFALLDAAVWALVAIPAYANS